MTAAIQVRWGVDIDLRVRRVGMVVMGQGRWEHYSHPSDVGIRGIGSTREEAFVQAALALTAVLTDPGKIEPKEAIEMACQEEDDELLFYEWLSSLLYEMGTRDMLFGQFELHPIEGGLKAIVRGERVDVDRHEPAVEVKAATYGDLKVYQDDQGDWVAQCVVDV